MEQNWEKEINTFLEAGTRELNIDCSILVPTFKQCLFDVEKQVEQKEKERMLNSVGLLRQWLNERTESMELITNKDIETFLSE